MTAVPEAEPDAEEHLPVPPLATRTLEAAGTVVSIGPGVSSSWLVRRVVAGPGTHGDYAELVRTGVLPQHLKETPTRPWG